MEAKAFRSALNNTSERACGITSISFISRTFIKPHYSFWPYYSWILGNSSFKIYVAAAYKGKRGNLLFFVCPNFKPFSMSSRILRLLPARKRARNERNETSVDREFPSLVVSARLKKFLCFYSVPVKREKINDSCLCFFLAFAENSKTPAENG